MKRPASATLHSLRCRLFRRATAGREAFAIIETLIVIGVIGAVTALTIPLYREYQIRSDLDNAAQLAQQGLGRAKLLSQSGERDSQWGFYVPNGTLYKGPSYENRDQSFDEVFPMPSTIAISGLLEVGYSKIEGKPNAVGDIVLRALNNDERTIQVTIAVDSQTIPTNQGDVITICHQSQTIQVPDATWPTHQSHGDTLGPCAGGGASSVASSAASSTQSSAGTSSSAGGGGGGASSAGGGGGGAERFRQSARPSSPSGRMGPLRSRAIPRRPSPTSNHSSHSARVGPRFPSTRVTASIMDQAIPHSSETTATAAAMATRTAPRSSPQGRIPRRRA